MSYEMTETETIVNILDIVDDLERRGKFEEVALILAYSSILNKRAQKTKKNSLFQSFKNLFKNTRS